MSLKNIGLTVLASRPFIEVSKMSLIKTGGGVTDIRGGFGGVYFTRDKSGLHSSAKPRKIYRRSAAQDLQRNAFIKARTFCRNELFTDKPKDWLNRCVSYNIYRALNNLYVGFFATVTGDTIPDCTGTYFLRGQHNGKDYYQREDGFYFIWWWPGLGWYISIGLGTEGDAFWVRLDPETQGEYDTGGTAIGKPTVALSSTEPPADYQIPKL